MYLVALQALLASSSCHSSALQSCDSFHPNGNITLLMHSCVFEVRVVAFTSCHLSGTQKVTEVWVTASSPASLINRSHVSAEPPAAPRQRWWWLWEVLTALFLRFFSLKEMIKVILPPPLPRPDGEDPSLIRSSLSQPEPRAFTDLITTLDTLLCFNVEEWNASLFLTFSCSFSKHIKEH